MEFALTPEQEKFGQDFGENKYEVNMQNLPLTTNWKKYIIPIPDAAKLEKNQLIFIICDRL